MKVVLLICYSFPPHKGIGGRRWAKFAKYLTKNHNVRIDVINAKRYSEDRSFWINDVENNAKINVTSFSFQFQKLVLFPRSFIAKLLRKLIVFFTHFTKFSTSFITSFPNKHIWKTVQEKIESNQYSSIIVSGDPFLFYYASLLKRPKNCELILDYRDLWNDHSFYKKNVSLTVKQKQFFLDCENYAVNHCDKILFVDQHLEFIIKKRIDNATPTFVINNGFDKNDYVLNKNFSNSKDSIKLFFAGNISSDLNKSFIHFLRSLKEYNANSNLKIHLRIVGNFDEEVNLEVINKQSHYIFYDNELSYKKYIEELSQSEIGIVILSNEYINSFTTKFSDYIAMNKYILCIGESGNFSDFIAQHKIGCLFNHLSDVSFFSHLISEFEERKVLSENIKDSFDIEAITANLVPLI